MFTLDRCYYCCAFSLREPLLGSARDFNGSSLRRCAFALLARMAGEGDEAGDIDPSVQLIGFGGVCFVFGADTGELQRCDGEGPHALEEQGGSLVITAGSGDGAVTSPVNRLVAL